MDRQTYTDGRTTYTDKLQRVLVAAARVVTSTRKYDRGLSRLLHEELHWLDVPERILFKLCVFIHQCLNNKAPQYLMDALVRRWRLYRVDSVFVLPDVTTWYQGTGLQRTDVALSSLLDRQLGMTCLMNCVTFLFLLFRTAFRSRLKTYFFLLLY